MYTGRTVYALNKTKYCVRKRNRVTVTDYFKFNALVEHTFKAEKLFNEHEAHKHCPN
jgi:hypothetical protein